MIHSVKSPQRTCIGCGEIKDKKKLIRVVHTPEGNFRIDAGGKMNGRGAYLCPDAACLEKAFRTKAFARAFRCAVPSEAVEELKKELTDLAGQ